MAAMLDHVIAQVLALQVRLLACRERLAGDVDSEALHDLRTTLRRLRSLLRPLRGLPGVEQLEEAARALGASSPRILFTEILPNTLGPIIVLASLGLGTAVIIESAMSFLGFGLPPPTPTWGWTLAYGTRFIRDEPWLSIISGATIMITVLGFNLLGDGLRDVLDPRQLSRSGGNK